MTNSLRGLIASVFIVVLLVGCISSTAIGQEANSVDIQALKSSSPIDLSHWKVTLPVVNDRDRPIEIEPPEIFNFANIAMAQPYMYLDESSKAIVFHAMPTNSTTANTKYTRCELREQMVPGSNNVNWTFVQGGTLKAEIQMDESTKDSDGKYHRTIIAQIHGRLTDAQKESIGAKDHNAPPILKIYWDKGKIRVKTKELVNPNAPDKALLYKEAWKDDEGYNFPNKVDFRKFELEIQASEGELVVILNGVDYKVYKNIHMERWGLLENYFKAGNYFQSRDEGAYSKVKFYKLEVSH